MCHWINRTCHVLPYWYSLYGSIQGAWKNILSCIIARIIIYVYKVLGINSAILLHSYGYDANSKLFYLFIMLTDNNKILYPEWPHRQCVGLAFRRSHDRSSLSAASLVICSPASISVCSTWSSEGTALCRVGGATSQFDLPSLTPLSIAGCRWLQPEAPHRAT